jgi:hypothetical protein
MVLCKEHQSRFDLIFAELIPEERTTGQVNRHDNSTVGVSELAPIVGVLSPMCPGRTVQS